MGKLEANSKPHSGCTELKPLLLGDERWVTAVSRQIRRALVSDAMRLPR